MERRLTIAYITTEDARDPRAWSGIHYHLAEALRSQGHQLQLLGPLRPRLVLFLCKVFNQISLRILGKRFNYRDSFVLSKAYARILERRLARSTADVIMAPAGLCAVALLRTPIPIVHFNDRSIAGALEYHAVLSDLLSWSRAEGLRLERMALENAALTVYASDWAADAARRSLPGAAGKIRVIPMGANLQGVPDQVPQRPFPPHRVKLLFIGVDWRNKGGDIAVDAFRDLKSKGFDAELVVCGCNVPAHVIDKDVIREGFLSKDVPDQRMKLEEHLRTAHFLILPTRFEAYGIAFCEAAAYGIPALGSRTGGVPTIVEDGVTGRLFDLHEAGAAYAASIIALLNTPEEWRRMSLAARKRYEDHFNWSAFVKELMAQVEAAGLLSKA